MAEPRVTGDLPGPDWWKGTPVSGAPPPPAVIGYDGAAASEKAVLAATVLATWRVLVILVFEAGAARCPGRSFRRRGLGPRAVRPKS